MTGTQVAAVGGAWRERLAIGSAWLERVLTWTEEALHGDADGSTEPHARSAREFASAGHVTRLAAPGPSIEKWYEWARQADNMRHRLREVCMQCALAEEQAVVGRLRADGWPCFGETPAAFDGK